jgi:predicted regulator of Ras-like GTPase activity (Roadblock/LC7/MglB family)
MPSEMQPPRFYDLLRCRLLGLLQSTPESRHFVHEQAKKAFEDAVLGMTAKPEDPERAREVLDDGIRPVEAEFSRPRNNTPEPPASPSETPPPAPNWLHEVLERAGLEPPNKKAASVSDTAPPTPSPKIVTPVSPVHPSTPSPPRTFAPGPPPLRPPPLSRNPRSPGPLPRATAPAPAIPRTAHTMEKPMSRTDELNKAFRKLQGDLRGVEAYATVPAPAAPRTAHTMEKSMSRTDELNRALRKFQEDSPGVEACALVSDDGLTIASILPVGMEETRVGGMGATLLSLATRASVQLNRGVVREVVVRGEGGYVVMIGTRRNALLMAVTNEASKLGMIFFDMHEAIRAIEKIL